MEARKHSSHFILKGLKVQLELQVESLVKDNKFSKTGLSHLLVTYCLLLSFRLTWLILLYTRNTVIGTSKF